MSISQHYAEEVGQALAANCPHVDADPEAMEAVKVRILRYDSELGFPPDIGLVLTWTAADELRLSEEGEISRQEQAARTERKRLDGLSVEETRLLAEEEFRAAHPKVERQPLVANTSYSAKEIADMSSETYAIKVLGQPAKNINLSQPRDESKSDFHTEYRKRQIMSKPLTRDAQLNQTLRRMVLEGQIK